MPVSANTDSLVCVWTLKRSHNNLAVSWSMHAWAFRKQKFLFKAKQGAQRWPASEPMHQSVIGFILPTGQDSRLSFFSASANERDHSIRLEPGTHWPSDDRIMKLHQATLHSGHLNTLSHLVTNKICFELLSCWTFVHTKATFSSPWQRFMFCFGSRYITIELHNHRIHVCSAFSAGCNNFPPLNFQPAKWKKNIKTCLWKCVFWLST